MKRIFSFVLALCLCIPFLPVAYAQETIPTPQQAYEAMMALKATYPEGKPWTNDDVYFWKGGVGESGAGCMAFAFILSDAAFGDLPARQIVPVSLSDVKVGDILRVNGNTHGVIVLQVNGDGVVVAEGNYNASIHWGRTLLAKEVEAADFLLTRWPEGYDPGLNPDETIEGAEGTLAPLQWKVSNNGTLTISGTGDMPEIDLNDLPWKDYADRVLTIKIDNGVTIVSANAFRGSGALSVTIPASVKTIGDSAFRECNSLISVTISEGVERIGGSAFQSCAALTSITLPASVKEVGEAAFWQCQKLETVTFQPGSTEVTMGNNMFTQCYALSSVTLPKQIDRIGVGMFQNCQLLTSVIIPDGAVSIDQSAFASCAALTEVWIPDSVTTIGIAAFSACPLNAIYFGGSQTQWDSITKIGDTADTLSKVEKYYNTSPADTPDTPDTPGTPDTPDTPDIPDTPDEHEHVYGDWIIDVNATATQSGSKHRTCTICGDIQTQRIPATGSSSSSASSSFSDVTTITTRNPDGSTTTTSTDSRTGTVTKTTRNPDGSQTVVETQKDGTVTTWETDRAGNKTETVANPDGSSVVTVEQKDGTTAAVSTDPTGQARFEVSLPASLVGDAQLSGEVLSLPIPEVPLAYGDYAASTVTVKTGSEAPVKVAIPTAAPTPGTVVVMIHGDGSEEIVKTSVSTKDGMIAPLPDGAVVKITDNSKIFADVFYSYWGADAIDFISARELFVGTTKTTFTPEAPMTRAMLMVVLARLDGADTAGGSTWYEKGVEWSVNRGVSDGVDPKQNVTREQLVTMLWRYMGSPSSVGAPLSFADADQISGYAQEAMRWAVENGIVNGLGNGLLSPQGQATRAQVAQVLKNFIEQYP